MLYKLQEDRGYDFLEELDSVVTKRMVLSLKLNEYNKLRPNGSISVLSFTPYQNLLHKFNESQE